ncbi:MAG TPA: hypothetical protein VF170_06030 [Planctomycetaceae bacterium]
MRTRRKTCWQLDELEPRIVPAVWVVIPPGTGAPVVEQSVPDAAIDGLVNAAFHANAAQGRDVVCWIVRFDEPSPT